MCIRDRIERQRKALRQRPEQQRADATDLVGEIARADAAEDATGHHQRQHLGAARHAIAEIAAIGDDMHLRHRHGDAAGNAGDRKQHRQRVGREFEIDPRRRCIGVITDLVVAHLGAQDQQQARHQHHAGEGDADMGVAPTDCLHARVDERRPYRAGNVVAACDDRHREAAIALEPVRSLRHQRREGR